MKRRIQQGVVIALGLVVLIAPMAMLAPAAGAAVVQGQSCTEYTPTDLAINVPSAVPGQTVVISGIGYPGDTVTIRIATLSGPPLVLGTALVAPSGIFSASVTIPADFLPGTYNITVTSPRCPVGGVITLVINASETRCGVNPRRLQRNETYRWRPVGNFDPSKPITITLVPRRPGAGTFELYSGPYASRVNITIPGGARNGKYTVVVSGTNRKGKPLTSGCRVRIKGGGGGGGSSSSTPSSSNPSSSNPNSSIPSSSNPSSSNPSSSNPSSSNPNSSIPSSSNPGSSTPGSTTTSTPSASSTSSTPAASSTSTSSSSTSSSSSSTSSSSTVAPTSSVAGSASSNPASSNPSSSTPGGGVLSEQVTASPTPKVGSASVLGESVTRATPTSTTKSGLAFTGSSIRPYLVGGIAAIALGGLIMLQVRRRRSS